MKKIIACLLTMSCFLPVVAQTPATPDRLYGKLFHDIQMAKIFPDGKTFVDCIPKKNPAVIVAEYKKIISNPAIRFSLQGFAAENFELPVTPQLNYVTKETDVEAHIKNLWTVLKREADKKKTGSSLLPLPYPYIVPGGRFREIYYWDSYFTMLGLKESGEVEMIENMIKNFAYLINTYGHIPNGNRSYYISRSQPPFFSMMVQLLADIKGKSVYTTYLPALEKEYGYWMEGAATLKPGQAFKRVVKLKDGTLLNRYWDENSTPRQESYKEDVETAEASAKQMLSKTSFMNGAAAEKAVVLHKKIMYHHLRAGAASGWDFSSRWFEDNEKIETIATTGILPVDLNCLLLHLQQTILKAKGKTSSNASLARGAAIQKYFWNNKQNFFTDYNFVKKEQEDNITPAGLFPFYFMHFGLDLMPDRGRLVAEVIRQKLLKPGGLVTSEYTTGQQWDAPNGWAPLQWMSIRALENCYQGELAKEIARRWIKINIKVFNNTGKLMEKYNVVDNSLEAGGGEYPSQDGFGWTNGVLLALIKKYGKE
jgi:alpha,alpha-trehalase